MVGGEIQILVVMGVSGSGKSTVGNCLARALGWSFLEADELHSKANIEKMTAGIPLTDRDRAEWLNSVREEMKRAVRQGNRAVVACSALKEIYRDRLRIDNRVQFVFLNVSFADAKRRLLSRQGHFMPVSLLESQFEILERPETAITIDVDAQHSIDQIVKEVVEKLQI